MREAQFEIYKSKKDGEWYWRFKAKNGEVIARSSEGYKNERDCRHGINLVKGAANAPVYDEAGNRIDKDGALSEVTTAKDVIEGFKKLY